MIYQVLINFNEKQHKPLEVAESCEEFEKTTVRELKEKIRSLVPGAPGPDHLRVFFGHDPLEDHLTLKFYKIQHLSVLCFVMKMPTGEGAVQPDEDLQFLQSLLPALKRMDLKHRQLTKLKMQQLVSESDFNDPNPKGIRRTDSMDKLPPKM